MIKFLIILSLFPQCSTGGLYSNVSFNNQSLFTQPRLAPQDQELQPKSFPKPIYSYRSDLTYLTKIIMSTFELHSNNDFFSCDFFQLFDCHGSEEQQNWQPPSQ